MLNKIRKSNNEGFTIIEVMIVLAIAGLIILIVLLAVPALQRNGRNTAIKNDASAVVAGISEFASNNDGSTPDATTTNANGTITFSRTGITPTTTAKIQGSTGYSDQNGAANVPQQTPGNIFVAYGAKCPAVVPTTGPIALTVNSRGAAVIYVTETPSATQNRCSDG